VAYVKVSSEFIAYESLLSIIHVKRYLEKARPALGKEEEKAFVYVNGDTWVQVLQLL